MQPREVLQMLSPKLKKNNKFFENYHVFARTGWKGLIEQCEH